MTKFIKGQSGNPRGRPKKRGADIGADMRELALANLRTALEAGEAWATLEVLARTIEKSGGDNGSK